MTLVTFSAHPRWGSSEVVVDARCGTSLLALALDVGIPLPHPCERNAACSECAVRIVEGATGLQAVSAAEREVLQAAGMAAPGIRLACQVKIGDAPLSITALD